MATVKVRVAVAVDHEHGWHAYGCAEETDGEMAETAMDFMDDGSLVHFITAELRVPDRTGDEVEATVEPTP